MCEKLKREVLSSNNKVTFMLVIGIAQKNPFFKVKHLKSNFVFIVSVAQSFTGGESNQRGYEVFAG